MARVTDYDLEYHIAHAQYWQGAGLAYTGYDNISVGAGETIREAYEDACEQVAMNGEDTRAIEMPDSWYSDADTDIHDAGECGEHSDECEFRVFVVLRYNN